MLLLHSLILNCRRPVARLPLCLRKILRSALQMAGCRRRCTLRAFNRYLHACAIVFVSLQQDHPEPSPAVEADFMALSCDTHLQEAGLLAAASNRATNIKT